MAAKRRSENSLDARHSLSAELVEALTRDFREHGIATIVKLRETDPKAYVQAIGAVVPKELLIGADRQPNSSPQTSRDVANSLLADVGLSEPNDSHRERALRAYDMLVVELESIRDEAIGLH